MEHRGRAYLYLFLALIIFAAGPSLKAQMSEDAVKAAYLLNFLRFTRPPESLSTIDKVQICIVGTSEGGDYKAIEKKAVWERPVALSVVSLGGALEGCHLAYFLRGYPPPINSWPNSLVITVGEEEDFCNRGGTIRFFRRDGRIGFEVSRSSGERRGVSFGSGLLKLAQIYD